jgi:hypothetical protein
MICLVPSAAATAATAATAEIPFFHGAGFIDREGTAAEIRSIELGNRLLGSVIVTHFHECESLRSPCVTISDDLDGVNASNLCEQIRKIRFRNLKR